MNRRHFFKRSVQSVASLGLIGGTWTLAEAKCCRVVRRTIAVPNLPRSFEGRTIAQLTDTHHGPFVPLGYLRRVVEMANALRPDLVVLTGDYVHRHPRYIEPGIAVLGGLRARLGRFAVLGNHDHWEDGAASRAALAGAGITELTNTGTWLDLGGGRIRICGVGDLWTDVVDVAAAVGPASTDDAVLLLSHNPDVVETLTDRRVGLVLSGHTHGGQVVVPGYGAPRVPSRYGQKYLYGLVQGPVAPVFVSRGVGTVTPPVRFLCPPEVALLTLTAG